jgi:hypothetical protein
MHATDRCSRRGADSPAGVTAADAPGTAHHSTRFDGSRMSTSMKPSAAVHGTRALGLAMAMAAVAKVVSSPLADSGWLLELVGPDTMVSLAYAELVLGMVLALAPRVHIVCRLGVAVCAAFLVLHLAHAIARGNTDCGCFGGLGIPSWVGLLVSAAGLVACACTLRRPRVAFTRPNLIACCVAVLASGAGVSVVRAALSDEAERTVQRVAADFGVGDGSLVIVGSLSCAECSNLVARYNQADHQRACLLLVSAPTDVPSSIGRVRVCAVSDQLWWKMVRGPAPSKWCVGRNRAVQLVDDEEVGRCLVSR